jgi:hypothetical protein
MKRTPSAAQRIKKCFFFVCLFVMVFSAHLAVPTFLPLLLSLRENFHTAAM